MSLNISNEFNSNSFYEKKENIEGISNISDFNENNKTIDDIVEHIPQIKDDTQTDSINKSLENSSPIIGTIIEIPAERKTDDPEMVEKKDESEDILEIKREKNYIFFFLLASGHDPTPFSEKIDTKIGTIIDKYIKNKDEKEEIRNTFYYRDKKIDDLNKTIRELEIEHLGFLHSKSN